MIPFDEHLEKSVLSAIIAEPQELFGLNLQAVDFYASRNKRLYETILSLAIESSEISLPNIYSHYNKLFGDTTIASYIAEVMDEPCSVSAQKDVGILQELTRQRGIKNLLESVLSTKWESADKIIESLQLGIIKNQTVQTKEAKIDKIGFRLADQIDINRSVGKIGEKTGFKFLDQAIEGFIRSHLWVLGAYTSSGKSAMMIQLIVNALKENNMLKTAIFSTEMTSESILLRFLANRTKVPTFAILKGESIPEVQTRIDNAFDYFHSKDLWIYDDVYTFEAMFLKCKQLKITGGLDVVFIDYLQNMQGAGSIYERMSDLAVNLQKMAKDLDVCVVAMSQVSNESAKAESNIIGYKGAGEIAAACDIGLWLERDREDERRLVCSIRKNRHGITTKQELRFANQFTRIVED